MLKFVTKYVLTIEESIHPALDAFPDVGDAHLWRVPDLNRERTSGHLTLEVVNVDQV